MTQSFGINANNDIFIGSNGNLVVLQGESAVAAAAKNASRISLGEEVLSTISGLPFFQAIFVGVPNLQMFNNYLITALTQIEGVTQVKSLTTDIEKDSFGRSVLVYEAIIQTQYSQTVTTIAGEIPSP